MEENRFHQLENEFPLAKIRSAFKKWFPLMSVTVQASRKELKQSRLFPIKRESFSKSRENPSPSAEMKDSLKRYVSTRRKRAYGLYLPENPFPLPGMKHSLKNTFSLYGETASSSKKIGNGFHQQENIFLLKLIHPNSNHGFQQQKKSLRTKAYCFHQTEIKFLPAKDSLKNMFSLDVKVTFGGSNV